MKKRVFLALLAAAAVTFVGCSKDDDGPDEGPQTYTITFEGDDWSPLVVANYNGGKAMSVVYEDKAYTWTDQTTQLTSPCPEGWGYPFMSFARSVSAMRQRSWAESVSAEDRFAVRPIFLSLFRYPSRWRRSRICP